METKAECAMTDTTEKLIPIIDLERIGLHRNSGEIDHSSLNIVAGLLKDTFCKFGLCYVKNHGIQYEQKYMHVFEAFYKQPLEVKAHIVRGTRRDFGYTPIGAETVNVNQPEDFKECFNYQPADDEDDLRDKEFQQACREMFAQCTTFTYRFLDALSLALDQKQTFLRDLHANIGKKDNTTTLRNLYYPSIPLGMEMKSDQMRFGEHSDYGTISLLFQDEVGGLDVYFPGKGFIEATPLPGTMLVIAADLMQRWTADSVVGVQHRVVIPAEDSKKGNPRNSAVFFILPDNESIIEPLDGSKKYKPITLMEYLQPKMAALAGIKY